MDTGAVKCKYTGLIILLQGYCTICPTIQVGYVGADALDGPYPWGRQPQVGPSDYGATAMVTIQRGVVLPTSRGGYEGGGDGEY